MQLVDFYHRHHLHRLARHPDLYLFELGIWLHSLAYSLIGVFIPILLLKTGYSITSVILYYLIFNAIDIPLNFAAEHLIRKIGARRVLILGTLAIIASFGVLGIIPPENWTLLTLLALLMAAYDALFWVSHIYIFIEASREELDTGKTAGTLESIRRIASVAGPLIGAVLLITSGKISLVIASVAIFALSIIPIFKMRHVRDIPKENKLSFRQFFFQPQEKRDYISMGLLGIHNEADSILWPLFIFTIFGTIGSVAAIPVIVSISTAIFSYLTGRLAKRYGTKMIIIGTLLVICTWVLRITLESTALYYVTIFLVGFFSLLVAIPLDGSIIARGLKIGSLRAATLRNASSMAARTLLYVVLILLIEVFKISFILAAISVFLILVVTILLNSRIHNPRIDMEELQN